MIERRGFTDSKAASSPPTMIVNVAFFAPISPPETGASIAASPRAAAALEMRAARSGRAGRRVDEDAPLARVFDEALGAEIDFLDVRSGSPPS